MKIRIESPKGEGVKHGCLTKVFINDVEQKLIRSAVVNFSVEGVPTVKLEFFPTELIVDAEVIPVQ